MSEIPNQLQSSPEQTNGTSPHILIPLGGSLQTKIQTQQQGRHWRGRNPRDDKPKHKKTIPGCAPWILVTTKFRRRFAYNAELGESFWKFPHDVLIAVADLDRKEAVRKERREKGEPSDSEPDNASANSDADALDDEYEEVEVTDDEEIDIDADSKRRKTEDPKPDGPVEFNEDDFAYQLALMDQGNEDEQFGETEFVEDEALHIDDAQALFSDLLADFRINPYTPWDRVITNMSLVEDPRYTCLPNMKSRRGVFDEWSRERVVELKAQREKQEKKDPKISYLALLDEHASPKLYWPEFKRKFQKEQAMKNTRLSDKDREKLYRYHINRLKLPHSTLKSDLKGLLQSQQSSQLNSSSSLEMLPTSILTDLRFISLRAADREPLIEAYIDLLGPPPDQDDGSVEDSAAFTKARIERQRRENALKEREQMVEADKKKRLKQERASRGLLRDGEADLERAMNVRRDALLGHIDDGGREKKDLMEQ